MPRKIWTLNGLVCEKMWRRLVWIWPVFVCLLSREARSFIVFFQFFQWSAPRVDLSRLHLHRQSVHWNHYLTLASPKCRLQLHAFHVFTWMKGQIARLQILNRSAIERINILPVFIFAHCWSLQWTLECLSVKHNWDFQSVLAIKLAQFP